MALVVNGVTIPTNVANAITVNGVDIKSVYHNGVIIWQQALSTLTGWSGQSVDDSMSNIGIRTSGMLFNAHSVQGDGAWITTNGDGTFTGSSSNPYWTIVSSGNNIKESGSTSWVTYNYSTETFSGENNAGALGITSGGGGIRTYYVGATENIYYTPYIYLT